MNKITGKHGIQRELEENTKKKKSFKEKASNTVILIEKCDIQEKVEENIQKNLSRCISTFNLFFL